MEAVRIINYICIAIMAVLALCMAQQVVYFFVRFFKRPVISPGSEKKRYIILVSARNEENVIGRLLESIRAQKYPKSLVDIAVVADNCTDNTADVVRSFGVRCEERFNYTEIGKGYALEYLIGILTDDGTLDKFDGVIVFDADNTLKDNYIEEINKVFCAGYPVVTSYRNSKNFSDNCVSFSAGLWFMFESEILNRGRMALGTNCIVSGTGYVVAVDVIKHYGGWHFKCLTEDTELSANCALDDIKIGYCSRAQFFDEQPVRIRDSWNQRVRWVKGFYQVYAKYGKALIRKIFIGHSFAAYDILLEYIPMLALTCVASIDAVMLFISKLVADLSMIGIIRSVIGFLLCTFFLMFFVGAYILLSNWRNIDCPAKKKWLYLLAVPLYTYSFFPIAIAAFRKNVQWKPIPHGIKKNRT